jgi:hypothetical protein
VQKKLSFRCYLKVDNFVEEVVGHDRFLKFSEERFEDDGRDVNVAEVENNLLAGIDFRLKKNEQKYISIYQFKISEMCRTIVCTAIELLM